MNEEEIRGDIREHIKQAIEGQRVMLFDGLATEPATTAWFMKGTPDIPRC